MIALLYIKIILHSYSYHKASYIQSNNVNNIHTLFAPHFFVLHCGKSEIQAISLSLLAFFIFIHKVLNST